MAERDPSMVDTSVHEQENPEVQELSVDEISQQIAAVRALAKQLQGTTARMQEHKKEGDELYSQQIKEEWASVQALQQAVEAIEAMLGKGTIDNQQALQLWSEATGKEFPVQLFRNIEKTREGAPILHYPMYQPSIAIAAENPTLAFSQPSRLDPTVSASVRVVGNERDAVSIHEDTIVGDDAILAHLEQDLSEVAGSQNTWYRLNSYYHLKRLIQKNNIVVPDNSNKSHTILAEILEAEQEQEPILLDRGGDYGYMLASLRLDALDSRRTDNIDFVLQHAEAPNGTSYDRMESALFELGVALDIAEHGSGSIFLDKNSESLTEEELMEHRLRAKMRALARRKELRSAVQTRGTITE